MPETPSPSDPKKTSQNGELSLWETLNFAWELGYLIAIPAFLLGFGGAYLDKLWNTGPFLMLLGFALALTISFLGVKRKVRQILGRQK